MAIEKELWIEAINENLFTSLDMIKPAATDDSTYLDAKTVHVPDAGASGTILKNPSRPLTVAERTDNDLSYDIDEWVMPSRLVPFADNTHLSYDKLQSLVNDIMGGIGDRVQRELLINWYTDTTYSVSTTGSSYAAHAPDATGNRKGLTFGDLLDAGRVLDNQNFAPGDRYLLVDNTMFYQLMDEVGITTYRDAAVMDAQNGTLPKLAGFNIIHVPHIVYLTTGGVARAYGATGTTTDDACALAVHKSALSWAVGDTKVFTNADDAIYAGDIVSGAVMAGGKYRRYSKKGVVPIIQTTP